MKSEMTHINHYRLRYTVRAILITGLMGMMVYAALFLVAFDLLGREPGWESMEWILGQYRWLHLTALIPLMFLLAGGFAAREISRQMEQREQVISQQKDQIGHAIEFAGEIGKGHLEFKYIGVNGGQKLGASLDEMRQGLVEARERETERKVIMDITGQVGCLLRKSREIKSLSDGVTAFLVNQLEYVVQGAFYVADDARERLDMLTVYAHGRKKHMHASFRFTEGLVGQAALERKYILRREIPEDYEIVSSGRSSHKKPVSLLLQPLITNEEVFGVIELASSADFTPVQLKVMQELSETIARTIYNVKINLKTRDLLNESRQMSCELGDQKKQLMEQADLMITTQEELKDSNLKLEEQVQEVHRSQKKSRVILENASEIITIYSESGEVSFVSPSIRAIMGYFPEELEGRGALENVHPQDADALKRFFRELESFPEQTRSLQYRYFTRSGEIIWLEATGKNFLGDPVINGLVVNSRDISVQILAEKEQRMRAKMQALSENSLDIIVRVDIFSRCTYINPVIESYTGLKPGDFIDKPLMEMEIDPSVLDSWKQIFELVACSREKQSCEMEFSGPEGTKCMMVNAIPEYYESGEIESVLMVCHDVTEAHQREALIKQKNKSISDSINYAYHIQSSLMPGENDIRALMPNSFMFYKPKDVVSGDYPWLYTEGDEIYIGAMDCTGHGVPGALMSLIGFFSQNEIVARNSKLNAGQLLDHLHHNVVKTLKQEEEDCLTEDGMDAAFCRINLQKRELHYAGAHRPLYHVSGGKLEVIKGNKFPVGSNQYSSRKDFTNHLIQLNQGDAIYIMTDGFPDQYGGPDGKQKYMSGRVRKLIQDHTHLSIFQMRKLFRDTFYNWKGETRQLDDILIIGIKF